MFYESLYDDNDATFKYSSKDNYTRLDAGGIVEVGYKLQKGRGMTFAFKYYFGFVDAD
jgi:hypothetical protein